MGMCHESCRQGGAHLMHRVAADSRVRSSGTEKQCAASHRAVSLQVPGAVPRGTTHCPTSKLPTCGACESDMQGVLDEAHQIVGKLAHELSFIGMNAEPAAAAGPN